MKEINLQGSFHQRRTSRCSTRQSIFSPRTNTNFDNLINFEVASQNLGNSHGSAGFSNRQHGEQINRNKKKTKKCNFFTIQIFILCILVVLIISGIVFSIQIFGKSLVEMDPFQKHQQQNGKLSVHMIRKRMQNDSY